MGEISGSRYLLWIEIDGFYAGHHPEIARPLIVERDKLVLDANEHALKKGVVPGMEAKQAKALVERCVVLKWQGDSYLAAQNSWLDLCARFTGVIEPIDQHIAALDLSNHPDPLDISDQLIRDLVRLKGKARIRYGAASSKWIANLAARLDSLRAAYVSPIEFLAPLPVANLLPVAEAYRERLNFLGYHTIGDVAQVPLETLQNQFGQEGLLIKMAANGGHHEPVQALYPMDSLREILFLEAPDDSLLSIETAFGVLADRLGKRLLAKNVQGSLVVLQIECEGGSVIDLSRRFMKPVRNPGLLRIAFGLMIQEKLSEAIVAIRASLFDLEPVRHTQQSVFGSERRTGSESLAAVKYVRTVFGEGSIKLASEVEIPRRVKVLKEWQVATGWR